MSGLESLAREDLLGLIAMQQRQIEDLKAQVADLQARSGRNSGNSSMPPSSDGFVKPERRRMNRPAFTPQQQF
jgi:transposase